MQTPTKDIDYYMSLPYSILLTPISEEDGGGWLAEIPQLPGCMSDGETQQEALNMIEDARRLCLESSLAHGDPIPEPALNPSTLT
ncbi:MAG TPA: type II toxin-antitoxin system HicB family antitoxin [Aggregatilineales bacterium]|nr:type II toxin-antitoxin system HicB family antitoxin [Aggregatilineales bacterium]